MVQRFTCLTNTKDPWFELGRAINPLRIVYVNVEQQSGPHSIPTSDTSVPRDTCGSLTVP